jgi:hypothetical protein
VLQNSLPIHRRLLSCGGWNPEEGGNYAKTEATMAKRNKQLSGQPSVTPFNRRRTPMPHIAFRTPSITIPAGTGRRSIPGSATFDSNVINAGVGINGFGLDFVNSDRHINFVEADVDFSHISGKTVNFVVECEYKDATVDPDDDYKGYVSVFVVAEVQ